MMRLDWRKVTASNRFCLKICTAIFLLCVYLATSFQTLQSFQFFKRDDEKLKLTSNASQVNTLEMDSEILVTKLRTRCAKFKNQVQQQIQLMPPGRIEGLSSWVWMTSPMHNLFYCAIPKCASTTWKNALIRDVTNIGNATILDHHKLAIHSLSVAHHLHGKATAPIDYVRHVRSANRLLIVRNPWSRIVSAYTNKILGEKWSLKSFCPDWEKYFDDYYVTFEEFLNCTLNVPPDVAGDPHTQPYTKLCLICSVDYNIVVKQEELPKYEDFIKGKIGIKNDRSRLTREQISKKYQSFSEYYKPIPNYLIEKFKEYYKYDLTLFDYPDSPFIAA